MMKPQSRVWVLKTLSCAVALCSASLAQANSKTEVEQLRHEVKELRAMLEQYVQQPKPVVTAASTPSMSVAATPSTVATEKRPLGLTVGGAEMNIYGMVRADASYQIEGGPASRLFNQINSVALEGQAGHEERLKSTLATTRLGLDFKTATAVGNVGGKVEVDFLGANDNLRIRHAYLTYKDWLVGQTWSNFAVPDYMPESIDAFGYVGGSVKRTPQVRYNQKISPDLNVAIALEDPKDPISDLRLPALTARANYKFADAGIISARTMLTEKKTDQDEDMAWGVGLGVKYELVPSQTILKADYYHVKGDNSFVLWSNPGIVVDGNKNIVEQAEFDSITVGLTQQFDSQWRGTVGYGYMKHKDNDRYIHATANKDSINDNLWQAWANVFYSPAKPLTFGVEYVYGERETFAGLSGEDNRVSVLASYNF